MTPVETAAFALSIGALLSRFLFPPALPWLLLAAGLALAAALFVNPARWQLYPLAIALLLTGVLLWQPQRFGVGMAVSAGIIVTLSAILAQLFALPRLSAPSGPYTVGTIVAALERPAETGNRQLMLKIWYPARKAQGQAEGLWADLQGMTDIPWGMRKALAYLSRVATHSHAGADYDAAAGPARVLIYNHSFVSWASENSLLVEELASRGYVVVAVRHRGQMAEYEALDAQTEDAARKQDAALQKQLSEAGSREARAQLSQKLAEIGTASTIARRRSADSRFLADRLMTVLAAVPGFPRETPDHYGAIGFSLGGAVSTSLCVGDPRCRAVVNIDGGIHGVDYAQLRVPHYLMIYGRTNIGGGDAVLPGAATGYEERIFPEAAHADFHDAAIVLPVTRWFFGRSTAALVQERREMAETIGVFLSNAFERRMQIPL